MAASFWDNPDATDDKPVVRHAPDDGQYHHPDWDVVGRMPGSKVGAFAVIPSAKKNGISKGFNGTKAGVVHVDPDAPDGGAILDVSQIGEQAMDEALALSNYPHEVFYRLGAAPELAVPHTESPRLRMPERPRTNPVMPGAYVVPDSRKDGRQIAPLATNLIADGMTPAPYSPTYQPQESFVAANHQQPNLGPAPSLGSYQQQQHPQIAGNQPQGGVPMLPYGYQMPQMMMPPPDPNMAHVLNAVAALTQQVQQMQQPTQPMRMPQQAPRLSTMPTDRDEFRPPNRIGKAPRGDKAARKKARLRMKERQAKFRPQEYDEDEEVGVPPSTRLAMPTKIPGKQKSKHQRLNSYVKTPKHEKVITGFDELKIDFVVGPTPLKPRRRVIFSLPHGKQSAYFHGVYESEACVALVYDTRYEGSQLLLENLGEAQITLAVDDEVHTVSSLGLNFQIGVLDVVVLVKHTEEE